MILDKIGKICFHKMIKRIQEKEGQYYSILHYKIIFYTIL